MFGLCVFFAFVVIVACDDVEKEKATGIDAELGTDVVRYLQERSESVGGWRDLTYETSLASTAMIYLQCTYDKLKDDEFSGDATDECKKLHLKDATLLYGPCEGLVDSPREIVKKVQSDYWDKKASKEGEVDGRSVLEMAIKEAKKENANRVGCAYYYEESGIDYDIKPGKRKEEIENEGEGGDPVGEVACVFGFE